MSRITQATPADYATNTFFPRPGNLAYPGDSLDLTALTGGAGTSGATSYDVRDHFGTVVASGSWTGTLQTLGTAGVAPYDKFGWYRVHLFGPDRGDGAFTTDYGTCTLTICVDKDPLIPRAPLRATNPPNQVDGLDAPAMHGYCSLGGFRIAFSAQNIQPDRQLAQNSTSSGTSVTATLTGGGFGGAVTVESMVVLVHTVVGDDTGMAGDVTNGVVFNVGADVVVGAGATKVHTKVYYFHCANHTAWAGFASFPTFTCTTTNASNQSLMVIEHGPSIANAAELAFAVTSGTGSTAVITKDMTSIAGGNEYGLIAAVSADQGSCISDTGVPSISPQFAVGQILNGSCDSYGGGNNHTITYGLTGSPTNWTAVFVTFLSGQSYATALANAKTSLDSRYTGWGQYQDPNRPYRKVTVQTLQQTTAATVSHYLAGITQLVTDTQNYIPGFIGAYTGRNEPQGTYSIPENTEFCGAIYAGDASAIAAVPGYVSLTLNLQPEFFSLCDAGMLNKGAGGANAMHYHDYNMCDSDIAITTYILRQLEAGLTSRSLNTLPIFMSEGGHDTSYWPGWIRVAQSGTAYMLNMIAREVILRVPYEHQSWFYDIRNGFDLFEGGTNTWEMTAGGLYPGYGMHRAYACELYGKTISHALSFGDVYDNFVVGGVWRNPTDTTGVAVVVAAAGIPDITFAVGGAIANVPSSFTVVDCWGNTSTVAVTGRTFTLPVGERPTYVRLPAGVDIAARASTFGRSWMTVELMQYTDDGDGGADIAQMERLTDSSYLSFYAGAADGCYATAGNTTFPRHISIQTAAGSPVLRVDTIAAYLPATWQFMGPILKGALEYSTNNGASWVTALTWDNSATITIKNYDLYSDSLSDAYTFPQHYFEASLGGVLNVTGVRVRADIGTQGHLLDAMMSDPTGTAFPVNTTDAPISLTMAELMAFNKGANQGNPARR